MLLIRTARLCSMSRIMRKSNEGMTKKDTRKKTRTAVSLFTGAGGMDVGFENAGFDVLWANDLNEAACRTYERNHTGRIQCGPIEEFMPSLKQYEGIDLIFGGPPCQGFSVAGKMDATDSRSQLLWRFFEAVEVVKPEAFVIENVKALAKLEKWRRVRQEMFRRAEVLRYNYCLLVLNSCTFGVPQSRERMFMIASRTKRNVRAAANLFFQHTEEPKSTRQILRELGPAGSPTNKRICRAKITMASKPVLRKSPYAGMLFNEPGQTPESGRVLLNAARFDGRK